MNDVINVFHFIPGFNFGGIETRTIELYEYMNHETFKYTIVTYKSDSKKNIEVYKKNNIEVLYVPPLGLKTLPAHCRAMKHLFTENRVDVAHCYSPQSGLFFLYFAKKYNIKVRILHARTSSFNGDKHARIKNYIKRLERKLANVYLAVSKVAGQWLFEREDFQVIPNAIELKKYMFSENERKRVRQSYGVENELVIGHVGRNTYAKNHSFLLDVFAAVKEKVPDSKLMLVGIEPGDQNIRDMCVARNIEKSVIFCGYQKEVSAWYSAMDAFVFPSLFEGMPGSLIEAQVSGLKCFASDSITDEAKLTEDVHFISLEDGAQEWAKRIVNEDYKIRNSEANARAINDKGYSLEVASESLMSVYKMSRKDNKI